MWRAYMWIGLAILGPLFWGIYIFINIRFILKQKKLPEELRQEESEFMRLGKKALFWGIICFFMTAILPYGLLGDVVMWKSGKWRTKTGIVTATKADSVYIDDSCYYVDNNLEAGVEIELEYLPYTHFARITKVDGRELRD